MLADPIVLIFLLSALQAPVATATSLLHDDRTSHVRGPIFVNTLWNAKGSPYVLTGDYQVPRNITLTIDAGATVLFDGDFQILVKGQINIRGSLWQPVQFFGSSGRRPMLLFKSTNLSLSSVDHCYFSGPQTAIQLAAESEHGQDAIKNVGNLKVTNFTLNNSKIQTNGYESKASLTMVNGNINNSTIVGVYPLSEPIIILKSIIDSSEILSDSYNYGIQINDSTISNSSMFVGCCGSNIEIRRSRMTQIRVSEGDGSPVTGPLTFDHCVVDGLTVNLPFAKATFQSSRIRMSDQETIKIGVTDIQCSTISGNGTGKGIQVMGKYGYDLSDTAQRIIQSSISNFDTALTVHGSLTTLTIDRSNFIDNIQYNVYSTSSQDIVAENNYWGTDRVDTAQSTVFDYYQDIEYGRLMIDPVATAPINNQNC